MSLNPFILHPIHQPLLVFINIWERQGPQLRHHWTVWGKIWLKCAGYTQPQPQPAGLGASGTLHLALQTREVKVREGPAWASQAQPGYKLYRQ